MEERSQRKRKIELLRDTRGLTTVEYIIILCLIAIVGFAAWNQLGQQVKAKTADSTNNTIKTLKTVPHTP